MKASTGMELLARPVDAADPGFHFRKQLQEIAPRFLPLFLFSREFVEIMADQAVYRCILFHGDATNFLQNGILDRERDVFGHASTVTVFLCDGKAARDVVCESLSAFQASV
jgi:hypothetical protein